MTRNTVTLEEVAKLLGISRATVNYYTNLGLFRVSDRKGNSRLYDRSEVLARFEKIKEMRKGGYTLMLIQQQLAEVV
ncbi:MAG TPA: helix-turn-helix domain-containing protein [Candidatus Omnitrophota bacterium]|nr:helix-turn-helix domain-containing protein [Candidatus Omnitrophota bacterium]